jgi:hypothetical protein
MCRRGTKACFHHLDFQSKNFHMIFLLSKNGLCMWISAYLLVEIDDFLKVPDLVWAWDFVDMYLTHLGRRIQRGPFHIYLRKWFFWTLKDCCLPRIGANFFSSTLNAMISQMVRHESVTFDRRIDIEVSYKILQLKIPKLVLILHNLACFQKGLFGGNFEQKHPWSFRGLIIFIARLFPLFLVLNAFHKCIKLNSPFLITFFKGGPTDFFLQEKEHPIASKIHAMLDSCPL